MRRLPFVAAPSSHAHCLRLVKTFDNENFVINVLQPQRAIRLAHLAVRALNVELVQIRSNVSNEDMGRLRVQFFRDAVLALEAGAAPPRAPVLDALAEAFGTHPHLPFAPMHTLLDAREDDLKYPNVATLPALEAFARRTHGALVRMHVALLCADGVDENAERAADAAGVAVGLAVLLRGAPAAAASRLSYMPRVLARDLGVPAGELLRGGAAAAPVFEAVARAGIASAMEARERARQVPPVLRPALWGLRVADIYFARLRRAGFDPFDDALQRTMVATYPLRLQVALLGARLFRTV